MVFPAIIFYLFIANEPPPAPKLINAKKTKYVYPVNENSTSPSSNFVEWNTKLQKPIFNKNFLLGVIPCEKCSICNESELTSQAYEAKLVFHRQKFTD